MDRTAHPGGNEEPIWNFAPTPLARQNLLNEGRKAENIYVTGNTVIDAMQHTVKENYNHPELDWVGDDGKLIFITAHRRENLGEPMHHMFRAIRRVLDEHPECKAIYPIHMNPVVRQAADEELGNCDQIHIIEPIEVSIATILKHAPSSALQILVEFKKNARPMEYRFWS